MKVFATRVRRTDSLQSQERVLFQAETPADLVQCGLLVREHNWEPATDGCFIPLELTNGNTASWLAVRQAIRSSNDAAQAIVNAKAARWLS